MRITVVGDTLLDQDLDGVSTRLCPDAPVPVVEVTRRTKRAGGAGLVATLLARDGHEVELVTALSDDEASESLLDCLREVTVVPGRLHSATPTKTRVRVGGQPLSRIDEGCGEVPLPEVLPSMIEAVGRSEAIVVADYGRGMTAHPELRAALAERARAVPLVWDPHPRGTGPVPNTRLITPNLAEACGALGRPADAADAEAVARALCDLYGGPSVAVTLGMDGALLCEPDAEARRVEAVPVFAADPCGAGDRFAATAALLLAGGASGIRAVRAAVIAASAYLAAGGVESLVQREEADVPRRRMNEGEEPWPPHRFAPSGAFSSPAAALASAGRSRPPSPRPAARRR